MTRVLESHRHFELIPEREIRDAQESIRDEIEPYIHDLLARAESAVHRLERREQLLRSKRDLQRVRLGDRRQQSGRLSAIGDTIARPTSSRDKYFQDLKEQRDALKLQLDSVKT